MKSNLKKPSRGNRIHEAILDKLYKLPDPGEKQNGTSFGSVTTLAKATGFERAEVEDYSAKKDSHSKFKAAIRNHPELRVHASRINHIWCMDLAIMDKIARVNDKIKYLLVCVDVFSRVVRVEPMKNKFANETLRVFKQMTSNWKTVPEKIWTDEGTEFAGVFKRECDSHDIEIYHTSNDTKAALAERAIRSLKRLIYRWMEESKTDRYVDKLQRFVDVLNARPNRSLGGKAPRDMTNADYLRVHYGRATEPIKKPSKSTLHVGCLVRMSKPTASFHKRYKRQFTNNVFIIYKTVTHSPIKTYALMDMTGEKVDGKFYDQELSKVIKTDFDSKSVVLKE